MLGLLGNCRGVHCVAPAPGFRGSFIGVVGKYVTRLPEYVHSADELDTPDDPLEANPYYTYPRFKRHPVLSQELPNLTHEGVEHECFGAACSMVHDGSQIGPAASPADSYAWLWLHYVPVGEDNLENAVAALGRVQVSQYEEGEIVATLGEPTAWLVPDEGRWSDPDTFDVNREDGTKKAFVGRGVMGWITKSFTTVSVRYYNHGSGTVVTNSWPNTAMEIAEEAQFKIAEISRFSFPLALGVSVIHYSDFASDSSLRDISRVFRIGNANLGTGVIDKPDSLDEADEFAWDNFPDQGNTARNNCGQYRASEDSAAISPLNSGVWIRAWEVVAAPYWRFNPPSGNEISGYRFHSDFIVTHSPYAISGSSTLPDLVANPTWSNEWVPFARLRAGATPFNAGTAITVGQQKPSFTIEDEGTPEESEKQNGILYITPGYGFANGWTSGSVSQEVDAVANPWHLATAIDGGGVDIDAWPGHGESGRTFRAKTNSFDRTLFQSLVIRNPSSRPPATKESATVPVFPATAKARWIATGVDVMGDDDTEYHTDDFGISPALEIPNGYTWEDVAEASGGFSAWYTDEPDTDYAGRDGGYVPFYDASIGDSKIKVMPAPTGFYPLYNSEGAEVGVGRARFGIVGHMDTAHPTGASVYKPDVSSYS